MKLGKDGNVLVLGGGGREHALVKKLRESDHVKNTYCLPGNAGMWRDLTKHASGPININDFGEVAGFVEGLDIGLTVVGPEAPLVNGIVDHFKDRGLVDKGHFIFGPTKAASQLEGSKVFAKEFMRNWNIPTADFETFNDQKKAMDYVASRNEPLVVKADGLAGGKGVLICKNPEEAKTAIEDIMIKKIFGDAGERVVVEEFLEGREVSMLVLTDGNNALPLMPSKDYKRAYTKDRGPNTGGMGAFAHPGLVNDKLMENIIRRVVYPTLTGAIVKGMPFVGCLYFGLMIEEGDNPKVLEYNIRFGDPEAQVVLPMLKSDLYELAMSCVMGKLEGVQVENRDGCAVGIVLANKGYPGDISDTKGNIITGLEEARGLENTVVYSAAIGKENGEFTADGGRVAVVTGLGDNLFEAIERAIAASITIKWEGKRHRYDIGLDGITAGLKTNGGN